MYIILLYAYIQNGIFHRLENAIRLFTSLSGRESGDSAPVTITIEFFNWLMSKAKYYKKNMSCTLSVGM